MPQEDGRASARRTPVAIPRRRTPVAAVRTPPRETTTGRRSGPRAARFWLLALLVSLAVWGTAAYLVVRLVT